MTVVHFSTELSGGAGSFVKNIHLAMQDQGLSSVVLTRERNDLRNCVTIKPLNRVSGSLRARIITLLGTMGVLNTAYALFGIEKSPVGLRDVQQALETCKPSLFVFYWVSYFVSFPTMQELRRAYPEIPFVFVCMDDALLTGGCHYSWGCLGYQQSCSNCPATTLHSLKKYIERGFLRRQALVKSISPVVIYPTSNMLEMGKKSAVLCAAPSTVLPLGALSSRELNAAPRRVNPGSSGKEREKVTVLVRSSGEYRKGCDLFVSALEAMSEVIPDLGERLRVVSIGDRTLTDARIDRWVEHVDTGYVKREELLSIYRAADAIVVTSREDGGPLMTNEGVALGIFVISTPVGVARDLIVPQRNGFITPEVSSAALASSLTAFLDNYQAILLAMADPTISPAARSSLTFEGYIATMMDAVNRCQ